jgi:hypothetical protein
MLETERVLLLDPIPDTAAPATTINQGGGITSTATSMVVTSTTNFPTEGRILIDSEVIGYTLATNTAPITVSGMTRGLEGTTAATHTNAAAITLRNLFVWGQRMYQDMEMRNYYITGTAAFTNASTTVTGTTTAWANGQVSAGDMIGITANATTTMPRKWYTIASIATDTSLTLTSAYAEPNYSTNTYIISSPNPFPGYCDGMLKAYATSMLIKKTGRLDLANIEFVTARTLLATAMQNQRKSDTFLHARTVDSYGANTRMPLWIRNSRV